MRCRTLLLAPVAAALMVACGDPYGLARPTVENVVDTITLGALRSTGVSVPSAYSLSNSVPVRTDLSSNYDFAYDIDPTLGPVLLPAQLTGVYFASATNPGILRTTTPFDSIKIAPSNGYKVDQPFTVDSGDSFIARSLIRCGNGVPEYGKLQILAVDSVAHTVKFKIMVNNNCGYRGLQPGLPGN